MNKAAFAQLAEYMDLLLDCICVVDEDHYFTYLSPGARRVFGYSPEEMVGRYMFDFIHPDDRQATRNTATGVNTGEQVYHFENRYIRKDGSVAHILWSARWSERDEMRVGVARDVSEHKHMEQEREQLIKRLEQMALMDPLTGLPNRALFYDRVNSARARAKRDGVGLGLLYLDLDKFKEVNDEYGHATGDALLSSVGQRIKHAVRATDTLARLGGDEFVVLVDGVNDMASVKGVADKIDEAMRHPFKLPDGEVVMSLSIGLALSPEHGETVEELLHHADQAMYRAKRGGGG
ncbi:signal peptide protein [Pseudidiomarina salinarum]|uniref:Signal peptide protein n=1 Tax=Pseudidiomarina salinarum TaxID=435908 RepID=A0A094IU34_9GAMM|nr:sensor domain-containing diguanylate cyclase [Pseudidiomarina salinarum]KFZ30652.1 signal peptide protein [Pseudidiomarina salinarum]RUO69171.1 sensor domain-containing diguanylate cyclase [Pseudidiomarina salinarum]